MNSKQCVAMLAILMTAMMTFPAYVTGAPIMPPEPSGQILEQGVTPPAASASTVVNVSALIKAAANEWVVAAEFFVVPIGDPAGADGTGHVMATAEPATARNKLFYAEFAPQDLPLNPGLYDVYVHGQFLSTAGGTTLSWDPVGDAMTLEVLHAGPVVSAGPSASPSVAPLSSVTFELTASISDTLSGGQTIIAAEYHVDAVDVSGSGQSMAFLTGADSPIEEVHSTIDIASFIQDYGAGVHTIFVHGRDITNAWGPYKECIVQVSDNLGPDMKNLDVTPNPTNGDAMVVFTARADDSAMGMSDIVRVEYFLYQSIIMQVQTAPGTGTDMIASDGAFDSPNEVAEAGISVTGLSIGTYRIFVHALDAQGNWGAYANITFVINDNDFPYFEGLRQVANPGTGTSLDLLWDAADDPSTPITYNIYMAAISGGQNFATPSATTQSTSYTYAGLTAGLTYYYIVRAQDAIGNEDGNTIEKSGMPNLDAAAPGFAGVQSVTDTTLGGELVVTWNAATDVSPPITYDIYVATTPGGQNFASPAATTTGLSMTLTGLDNDVAHYIVVRATDYPGNQDANTVELSATPTFLDLDDPVFAGIYQAKDAGTGSALTLNWSAAEDASQVTYCIYMSLSATLGTFNFVMPSATTMALEYTYGSLTPGITYYFIVRAKDTFSNEESNTIVKYAMVQFPDASDPVFAGLAKAEGLESGTEVRLSWAYATDSSPPIVYNIYRASSAGAEDFVTPTYTTLANETVIVGLTPGETYFFVVRAEDSRGNEDANTVEKSVLLLQPVDSMPPLFAGLASATDMADGGRVALAWTAATESQSPPVRYYVYWSQTPAAIDYGTIRLNLSATTGVVVDGLANDAQYRFAVRAVDALWNVDSNVVSLTATPTDSTPPVLGADPVEVSSTDNEGELYLSWPAASDNSGPVTYHVYYATQSGAVSTAGTPDVSTTSTSATLTGLDDATTYYVIIVAEDAEGNTMDMAEASGTTAEAETTGTFLWYAAIIGAVLLLLLLIVLIALAAFFIAKKLGGGKKHHHQISHGDDGETLDDMQEAPGEEDAGGKAEGGK